MIHHDRSWIEEYADHIWQMSNGLYDYVFILLQEAQALLKGKGLVHQIMSAWIVIIDS